MAIILLVSVTAIACNMEKVVKEPTKENGEVVTTKNFNGKTVVIDPGHGGDDPGKIGVNKEKEKDVNLAISKKLFQVLNEQGYKVVLTRSEDVVLGDGVKFSKIRDLNKRCEIVNNAYEEKDVYKRQDIGDSKEGKDDFLCYSFGYEIKRIYHSKYNADREWDNIF